MVYYLQQNVALLDQISNQLLSIAPQVPIPSTPPPPFPTFKPLASDVRANVLWFMALTLSLIAAFLAILIQQWGHNHMRLFQRYRDPLKCARIRKYLHDGLMQWHLPTVAESVPILFQISFILFSIGLTDSVLNVNMIVGNFTTALIASSVLCYMAISYLPTVFPHSPYQTLFSRGFWALRQIGGLFDNHRDSDGALSSVSLNMTIGQMQFAMVETHYRKERDEEAIQWLIRKMAEDAEMESLVMAIPGSFNCKWGQEVWKNVLKPLANDPHTGPMPLVPRSDPQNVRPYPTTAHIEGEQVMHELNTRVSHVMETCKKPDPFPGQEPWRQRTRGCVETVALLVCFTGTDLGQFGDIIKLLGDIGVDLKVRESSSEGKDLMFVMRWKIGRASCRERVLMPV